MGSPLEQERQRRLFEYFIVAGLSENAEELTPLAHECGNKVTEPVAPITDICVIFPGLGETVSIPLMGTAGRSCLSQLYP